MGEAHARRHPTRPGVSARVALLAEASWFWHDRWPPHRRIGQPMRVSDIIPTPLPFSGFHWHEGSAEGEKSSWRRHVAYSVTGARKILCETPGKPRLESRRTATEALGLPAEAHGRTHPLGVRTRGSDGNNSTQPRCACTHPSAAGTGRRKHARVRQSAHGGLFDSRSKPTQQRAQRRHGKRVVLAVFDHLGDVMMTLFRKRTCRG